MRQPSTATQQQRTNTIPDRVLLDVFPGTAAEKREAERIFREYADVPERGRNLAVHPPCITESTWKMTFQSTTVTGRSHPTSLKRWSSIGRNCWRRGSSDPARATKHHTSYLSVRSLEPSVCAWTTAGLTPRPGKMPSLSRGSKNRWMPWAEHGISQQLTWRQGTAK